MVFIYVLFIMWGFKVHALEANTYEVRPGDTLSSILYRLNIGPIYGPMGAQKTFTELNNLKSGDKIKVGHKLIFPLAHFPLKKAQVEPRSFASEAEDQFHSFSISPQISWAHFTSDSSDDFQHNDLKAYSKPIPSLHAQYELHWDAHWKILLFSSFSRVSFYPDDQVTYKKPDVSRNSFGMGLARGSKVSAWDLRLGFFDEIFFSFPSTTVINTTVVALPQISFSYLRTVLERKSMSAKLGGNIRGVLPYHTSSVQGNWGHGAGLEFLIGGEKKNLRLFYNFKQVTAKNNGTVSSELGIGFVMRGDFYE